MVLERTSAYVLAAACVFQALRPSGTAKFNRWRSIDVEIGRLSIQARNEADSATWLLLLHSRQKGPRRLKICIDDSGCITASLDGASRAWMISRDENEMSLSGE